MGIVCSTPNTQECNRGRGRYHHPLRTIQAGATLARSVANREVDLLTPVAAGDADTDGMYTAGDELPSSRRHPPSSVLTLPSNRFAHLVPGSLAGGSGNFQTETAGRFAGGLASGRILRGAGAHPRSGDRHSAASHRIESQRGGEGVSRGTTFRAWDESASGSGNRHLQSWSSRSWKHS